MTQLDNVFLGLPTIIREKTVGPDAAVAFLRGLRNNTDFQIFLEAMNSFLPMNGDDALRLSPEDFKTSEGYAFAMGKRAGFKEGMEAFTGFVNDRLALFEAAARGELAMMKKVEDRKKL